MSSDLKVGSLAVGVSPPRARGCPAAAGAAAGAAASQSPASVQIAASPACSTPGLTPELRQMLNADVEVRAAACLEHHPERDPSSDIDSGERCQVRPPWQLRIRIISH